MLYLIWCPSGKRLAVSVLGLNFLLRSVQSWFPSCSLMISSLLCTIQTAPSYRNSSMALIWFQINQIHEWILEYQVFGYLQQKSVHGLTELHKMAAVQACTLKHTEDQRLDTCSKPPHFHISGYIYHTTVIFKKKNDGYVIQSQRVSWGISIQNPQSKKI